MTPTIGRVVWYQAYGTPGGEYKSLPRAAIVTQVHNETSVDLMVCNPTGLFFNSSCQLDESAEPKGGTWRWPPRSP